jgi:D-arabinose 1-dehydrogenase-like Zn-dependent alcohol dehydrogenase
MLGVHNHLPLVVDIQLRSKEAACSVCHSDMHYAHFKWKRAPASAIVQRNLHQQR